MNAPAGKAPNGETVATNRKARRDFHILETWEAGIELLGPEVKSIRAHDVSLDESHARFQGNQLFLLNLHVKAYACTHHADYDPVRPRRLLVHRRELNRLAGHLAQQGHALVPLRLYLNRRGLIKVEMALCKGKLMEDKRETLKRKTASREAERAIAAHSRRSPG